MRLETGGTAEIVGTVAFHPSDPYKLLWTVQSDTIPTNDLQAITKIINPLKKVHQMQDCNCDQDKDI